MRTRITLLAVLCSTLCLSSDLLLAGGPEFSGSAVARLAGPKTAVLAGADFQVDVFIDLGDVQASCGAKGIPVALGAFIIPVTFDTKKVSFAGTSGCSGPVFPVAPTVTVAEKANQAGRVLVSDSQNVFTTATPSGSVCVSRLLFKSDPAASGDVKFGISSEDPAFSLACTNQSCPGGESVGPADLPRRGGAAVVKIAPRTTR